MQDIRAIGRCIRSMRGNQRHLSDPKPPYPLNGTVEKSANTVEKGAGKGCLVFLIGSGQSAKSLLVNAFAANY
jgi:hypothetical protein